MKKARFVLTTIVISLFILTSSVALAQQEKEKSRSNVKPEDAQGVMGQVVASLGFDMPPFGNDPCQSATKRMGGLKKYGSGNISLGKLPTKPTISAGKQGQVMEGEQATEGENVYTAENVCYEAYDSQGNKCLEATANPDGSTTFKNTSDGGCTIQLGEGNVLHLARKTEVTIKPREETIGKKVLWTIGKAWLWIKVDKPPTSGKSSAVGVRGNCDPYGITGGCIVEKGSAWVVPSWLNPMDEIIEAEKNGWIENLRWNRVNPSPEGTGPKQGPSSSIDKTHPGQATKSGYEKEKDSKVDKGGTIINPSESSSGKGQLRSIDLCGKHLPTPQEAAAMGFDPARITDPANREWTGRIEERGTERTLTWSKMISGKENVKVEYTYKNGELVGINYEFYDQIGNRIGYATYDAETKTVKAKRLK